VWYDIFMKKAASIKKTVAKAKKPVVSDWSYLALAQQKIIHAKNRT
jgi:hypothetical protein